MAKTLEALLERDGRLRVISSVDVLKDAIGQSFTIRIVGLAEDDDNEALKYTLASQAALSELWEDEPDELWSDL